MKKIIMARGSLSDPWTMKFKTPGNNKNSLLIRNQTFQVLQIRLKIFLLFFFT